FHRVVRSRARTILVVDSALLYLGRSPFAEISARHAHQRIGISGQGRVAERLHAGQRRVLVDVGAAVDLDPGVQIVGNVRAGQHRLGRGVDRARASVEYVANHIQAAHRDPVEEVSAPLIAALMIGRGAGDLEAGGGRTGVAKIRIEIAGIGKLVLVGRIQQTVAVEIGVVGVRLHEQLFVARHH
ncbi:hypothetical protein CATMIT_01976, partial [Catenibacterium mitsuokai DSM 15897]